MLLAAIVAAPPVLAAERAAKQDAGGKRWYVVPNVAFDADDGLGFGARGELAFDAPGHKPYRTAYMVHAFASLRGFHHHRFRFDRVGLGPGRRLRLTVHVAWRQWLNDGYWGIGDRSVRERAFVGSFDDDDPRRKRYRYSLFQPFGHLTARVTLAPRWSLFAALNTKWSIVESYGGSLLAEHRPYGVAGGLGVLVSAGAIYDSRQPEINPRGGVFAELSGRVALPMPEGAGSFGGPFVSLRGYFSPSSWLVLAGRLMGEWLVGDVPFFEMVHWGGSVPVAGFGGFETLRGVSFGRWRAPGKAVLNAEARMHVLRHTVFSRPLVWQLALFFDAGAVWGAESTTEPRASGVFPIHPAGGGGVRAIFQEAFVGRIDAGLGLDPVRETDGRVSDELSWGLYVVFDHAF